MFSPDFPPPDFPAGLLKICCFTRLDTPESPDFKKKLFSSMVRRSTDGPDTGRTPDGHRTDIGIYIYIYNYLYIYSEYAVRVYDPRERRGDGIKERKAEWRGKKGGEGREERRGDKGRGYIYIYIFIYIYIYIYIYITLFD